LRTVSEKAIGMSIASKGARIAKILEETKMQVRRYKREKRNRQQGNNTREHGNREKRLDPSENSLS